MPSDRWDGRSFPFRFGLAVDYTWSDSVVTEAGAMWVTGDTTFAAANPFISFAEGSSGIVNNTAEEVAFRAPVPLTIIGLTVRFASAVGGGVSATVKVHVNGADSDDLILTVAAGQTSVTASGSVSVAQDDLVCLHISAIAGSLPAVTSFGTVYKTDVEDGFVRIFTSLALTNTTGRMFFGGDSDLISLSGSESFLQAELEVSEGTIATVTAPGIGNGQALRFFANNGTSLTTQYGTTLTLDNTTSVRGTINATIPVSPSPSVNAGNGRQIVRNNVGSPALNDYMFAFAYTGPLESRSYLGFGHPYTSETVAATEYLGFNDPAPNTSTTNGQVVMPVDGTFKDILVQYNIAAGTVYDLAILVNGTPIQTWTLNGGATFQFLAETATETPVVVGDLVNFRITKISGAGTSLIISAVIGFEAELE